MLEGLLTAQSLLVLLQSVASALYLLASTAIRSNYARKTRGNIQAEGGQQAWLVAHPSVQEGKAQPQVCWVSATHYAVRTGCRLDHVPTTSPNPSLYGRILRRIICHQHPHAPSLIPPVVAKRTRSLTRVRNIAEPASTLRTSHPQTTRCNQSQSSTHWYATRISTSVSYAVPWPDKAILTQPITSLA